MLKTPIQALEVRLSRFVQYAYSFVRLHGPMWTQDVDVEVWAISFPGKFASNSPIPKGWTARLPSVRPEL